MLVSNKDRLENWLNLKPKPWSFCPSWKSDKRTSLPNIWREQRQSWFAKMLSLFVSFLKNFEAGIGKSNIGAGFRSISKVATELGLILKAPSHSIEHVTMTSRDIYRRPCDNFVPLIWCWVKIWKFKSVTDGPRGDGGAFYNSSADGSILLKGLCHVSSPHHTSD